MQNSSQLSVKIIINENTKTKEFVSVNNDMCHIGLMKYHGSHLVN